MQYSKDGLLRAYRRMATIRQFEERLHEEIAKGEIPGFTHLYAGQEAAAVGVCEHLDADDMIVSTHRGHGHCIAKGCDVDGMMKEIYGSREGLCKGRGGSMHIADTSIGMLGANGIVGAGAPQAVGAAIAAKAAGRGKVAIAFSCEAMNMAAVIKVPAIFVFENNHYSEHTGDAYAVGTALDIASRAEAFGMRAWRANGCDFYSTFEAMAELLDYVRSTNLPAAIELDTERFYGHFEGDPQRYRAKGEVARLREERDALKSFRASSVTQKFLAIDELDELDALDASVGDEIDRAVEAARKAERPDPSHVLEDVYASY